MQNVKDCVQNTEQNAMDKLKSGKACSNDGAEHLTNYLLSIFYSRVVVHGHLSDDFMKTIIMSLVKHKYGNTIKVNNYRPTVLITVASKLFEMILLEH